MPLGTVFVIHILPTIIFFSSLMALLYHLGVMQRVIRGMAWVMRKTMGTSGSETLSLRRQHLRGPDRGAPGDPALPARP